jgi:hypothetical protein
MSRQATRARREIPKKKGNSKERGRMTIINGKQPITKKEKWEIDFSHISTLFSRISRLI